jgi:hypothetical protein
VPGGSKGSRKELRRGNKAGASIQPDSHGEQQLTGKRAGNRSGCREIHAGVRRESEPGSADGQDGLAPEPIA